MGTETRPSSPPVTEYHWKTTVQMTWEKARVNRAKYTAERRTQNQPTNAPTKPAITGAAKVAGSMPQPSFSISTPVV